MKKIKKSSLAISKLLCSFTAILLLLGLLGETFIPPVGETDGTQVETYSLPHQNSKEPNPLPDSVGRD